MPKLIARFSNLRRRKLWGSENVKWDVEKKKGAQHESQIDGRDPTGRVKDETCQQKCWGGGKRSVVWGGGGGGCLPKVGFS